MEVDRLSYYLHSASLKGGIEAISWVFTTFPMVFDQSKDRTEVYKGLAKHIGGLEVTLRPLAVSKFIELVKAIRFRLSCESNGKRDKDEKKEEGEGEEILEIVFEGLGESEDLTLVSAIVTEGLDSPLNKSAWQSAVNHCPSFRSLLFLIDEILKIEPIIDEIESLR